jgi:lipopolysaccharide cholinephosphotransferase
MDNLSQYNPPNSELRKMQMKMLEMLIFIDSVCEKHQIKYWLAAGTLLGAVRHKGFIPWDDDLDIEMLREDYDKLIKVLEKELSYNYALQTHQTDRNYIFPIAKLRDKDSMISEVRKNDLDYKYRGIFIDIFYLDRGDFFLARLTVNIQKALFALTLIKNDTLGILFLTKRALFFLIHEILFPVFRFFARICKIRTYILPFGTGFTAKRELDNIFPLKKICFEGIYFSAPVNTDAYLKELYGDYMQLPAEDKRRMHTIDVNLFRNEIS